MAKRKTTPKTRAPKTKPPEPGGRLQQLVDAGDTHELAQRSMTLQSVLLDLHRQLAAAQSYSDLARTMGLALTGSLACERLVVLRRQDASRGFETVAEIGDVTADLHEEAPGLAASMAPLLAHLPPLVPLDPPPSDAVAKPARRLVAMGFERAIWMNVDKQIDWLILVGPKLSRKQYDEFDAALLRATLDASSLACARLLLVEALGKRNREILVANKRLQQIDDLKSAILAGVSHELRTPLYRILSYTEALREGGAEAHQVQEFLDVILDNTHQLGTRIGEALRFADLIGGRTAPKSERVALQGILKEVLSNHTGAADAGSVGLESQCQESLVVYTDPTHVRMILKCLVDNALQFTPPGGTVSVEALPHEAGAAIHVIDGGPGIPEDARERIWRVFESGDLSLEREHSGLGLSLALAKRLASEIGAELELVRTSAAGSVFALVFQDATPVSKSKGRSQVGSVRR